MANQEERVSARGILEIIASLTARRASGRLTIVTGTTEGELLFTGGNLVDARLGHLTGFQAVNALAAMDDAYVEFDSSVNTPMNSSMTSSERVVLKEFFGIESVDSKPSSVIVDDEDETTLITSKVPNTSTEPPLPPRPRYKPRKRRLNYRVVFAVSILLIALSVAAAAWLLKQDQQKSEPATATRSESAPASESLPPSTPAIATTTTTATNTDQTDRDLTGNWNVVNTVHSTSLRSFQNLRIGFALSINQTGKTFTAKGQKISENGRSLPASERTPIQLNGAINGDRIEATFSEQGAARKTSGKFVWKIDRAGGRLTGTFASTAARARGESTAKRQL
ncbi:MAG TPA: DUF4388 domain-containing protein [Pyrinomonadaceae bacterium]|nr:DUF4388 domain-containing protein [Pyrinomonadaceae bacterium]